MLKDLIFKTALGWLCLATLTANAQEAGLFSKFEIEGLSENEQRIVDEFRGVAKKIVFSNDQYCGRGDLRRLLAIDESKLSGLHLLNHWLLLSWHHLRLGNVDEALNFAEKAMELRQLPKFPTSFALMNRGLANLRRAEINNCIKRHNCDCCIFPLTGGGVHVDREPALAAKRDLLELLETESNNLHTVWILNLLTMALGEYPDGVPEQYRLPASAFKSELEIPRFKDVASQLGLDTFNLCGGAIVEDFDGDEKLDIVTSTYDPTDHMTFYRNVGDGSFQNETVKAKLQQQFGGLNCIAADYDNDGDKDLYVLRGAWLHQRGEIRNSLLQNDGSGKFTDVTAAAGMDDVAFPTQSGVWGDFNGDGFLDLYVVNESNDKQPGNHRRYPSQLYINQGDGTFVEMAAQFGVTNDRYGKGTTAGDFDNDGDLDIYVSNIGKNRLYKNEDNKKFVDVADELAVIEPASRSFATWFFDFNNDGWLDIFCTAYFASPKHLTQHYLGQKHNAHLSRLYLNDGDGTFSEIGMKAGLDFPCLPMGANFGDFDYDGWLDVYLTTGDPLYQTLMPNVMLKNDRGEQFLDVTTSGGFGHLQKGHGVAFADIDDDGDQDIYHQLGGFFPGDKFHNVLFENPGHDNHFLILKLIGKTCNRDAVGARVEVEIEEDAGTRKVCRSRGSISSFGGSPSRLEIGLGQAIAIKAVRIQWPNSKESTEYAGLELDSSYEITQGSDPVERTISPSKWKTQ